MKTTAKNVIREESGKILILVLVLLVVGGLLLTPLLGLMSTGLVAGQVYEKKAFELYAADAGVEDAIWRIANNLTGTGDPFMLSVNGKDVEYTIDGSGCGMGRSYTIRSIATTTGAGSTTVDVYLASSSFADNAITSRYEVALGNKAYVEGVIQYGTKFDPHNNAEYDEDKLLHEVYPEWPLSDELYSYYHGRYFNGQAWSVEYPHGHTISELGTEHDPIVIGPARALGDLTITGSGWIRLGGTLWVDGDLTINPSPGINLNLDAQTIFVEGDLKINPGVVISGSGNIIAVGDIVFQPGIATVGGPGADPHYVLVLSLEGNVDFQPSNDFTGFVMSVQKEVNFKPGGNFEGSVAGDVNVDLDSKVRLAWRSIVGAPIDFPFVDFYIWRIRSYNIS